MKTQIIKLEQHDDMISTRDKLNAAQANRIILIWHPKNGGLQNLKLDLTLLYRHCAQLGVQLGLVTNQKQVRQTAEQIGIPVFRNLRNAQTDRWRTPGRRRLAKREFMSIPARQVHLTKPETSLDPKWLNRSTTRLIFLVVSLLAVAAVFAVVIPRAKINLLPFQDVLSLKLDVSANPKVKETSLAGEFPLKSSTIIVEGRQSLQATGNIDIPEKPAIGEVKFTNLTENQIEIPAGTIVTTLDSPATRYFTIRELRMPAGVGMQRTTEIQAQVPGSSGNVKADVIKAIEGPLGLSMSVTNPSRTSQGSDRAAVAPSNTDRNTLYDNLLNSLKISAKQELENQSQHIFTVSDYPIIESLQLLRIIEETYSPDEGQPADQVNLLLRVEFTYNYVAARDIQAFAVTILNANTPVEFIPIPESLQISHTTHSNRFDGEVVTWQMVISQSMQERVDLDEVSMTARGMSISTAQKSLQKALNLDKPPEIQVSPNWWPFIPVLPYRIYVGVQSLEN